ncbi:hypothetical protein AH04_102 [Erwinia phage AH04]|uniref:Uncharacterized protein n=1 Tax=Erwinia phage AH04 TaxID=2869569 RepID=A0AAE7X1H6_9CAUD|nr:virion structural protein [Erwinia phage AH04]QZA70584.1 hypothetical protein AH04_102 [Erwinia phage AH04]
MSHLAHIVKLKQDLIGLGVVNPDVQADIVQTAYSKALLNVTGSITIDDETRFKFVRWILSYWNNVTPNKGNLIVSQVGNFFRELKQVFGKTITSDVVILPIVPGVEAAGDVKYTDLDSYASLVQILIDEANHKLPQFKETNQIS